VRTGGQTAEQACGSNCSATQKKKALGAKQRRGIS
jgi:hypothetical protein